MRSGAGPSAPACSGTAGAAPTIALLPIPQIVSLALPGPNAMIRRLGCRTWRHARFATGRSAGAVACAYSVAVRSSQTSPVRAPGRGGGAGGEAELAEDVGQVPGARCAR